MIIDRISNAEQYAKIGSNIQKAFQFILNTDLANLEEGKYTIDGEAVFATISEYETKDLEEGAWEAHKKYIDIQYMISGKEKMGYCNIDDLEIKVGYNEDKDILFLDGQGKGDFLLVDEGMFILFTPSDAHMPSIKDNKPQRVKKLVIKVQVD